MINFDDCDPRYLDDISLVVDAITSNSLVKAEDIMLVGAACRDVMHSALGHRFELRTSSDFDIALALKDWQAFEFISQVFTSIGNTNIRFNIASFPVDVIPFGAVEDPDGLVTPKHRAENIVVFGFEDIYQHASKLNLPNGVNIRIPQVAGYVISKMRAWIDRSPYGEYKDAQDIALALYWYQNSEKIKQLLYDTTDGQKILEATGFDLNLAAIRVLAADTQKQLAQARYEDLKTRWGNQDFGLLVRHLSIPHSNISTQSSERRLAFINQLISKQ
ncbi:MAG: hypothetical protein WBA28_09635 [Microbacteriaceae bacterium]